MLFTKLYYLQQSTITGAHKFTSRYTTSTTQECITQEKLRSWGVRGGGAEMFLQKENTNPIT